MRCNERQTSTRTARACALLVAVSLVLASAVPAQATLVFGDFEGTATGWGNWHGVEPPTPKVFFESISSFPHPALDGISTYDFSTSYATSGSQSMRLDSVGGFDFSLAYNATAGGAPAGIPDFQANDTITFDVTFAGGVSGGYNEIFGIAINTDSAFAQLNPNTDHLKFQSPDTSTDQTVQVSYDYSSVDLVDATYLQVLIATNNDSDPSHTTYYFDNFQLSSVPEPSSFAMLSLIGLLLGGMSTIFRRSRA